METLANDQFGNLHHFRRQYNEHKNKKADEKNRAHFPEDIFKEGRFQLGFFRFLLLETGSL
jgi:hypothetical protein